MTVADLVQHHPAVEKFLSGGAKKMLINGEWVDSASGETFEVLNPANKSLLANVAKGGKEDIDRAVKAARKAFDEGPWPRMSVHERSKIMFKLSDAIEAHSEEFAQLESLDNGKPINISRAADIPLTVEHFRYYAGWADKIEGETIGVAPPYDPDGQFLNYTLREPIGVAGQIIPWNFPLLMAAWKMGAALATGCCVILKPAEQTPLSALRLGELMLEVGIPAGVVNIVTGFGDAGAALAEHSDVDKIAFTGSTEVGKRIVNASAGNLKKVTIELGGKSPNIVFPDADLEQAAIGAAAATFFNQGQVCSAGSRTFIHESVYDEVISRMSDYANNIKVGNGMSTSTDMGPLVSAEQFERVSGYIKAGRSEGASVSAGGDGYADGELANGYFCKPTVFSDVNPGMKIVKDEIFGPVIAAAPWKNLEDIAKEANNTEYGLAAGIWTQDISKAHRLAGMLRAGTVWINCYNMFDAASPFGGYKQSGYGREMGKHALENYTQVKSVWVRF